MLRELDQTLEQQQPTVWVRRPRLSADGRRTVTEDRTFGAKVWCSAGFRFEVFGFKVWGLGLFGAGNLGVRVQGVGYRVRSLGLTSTSIKVFANPLDDAATPKVRCVRRLRAHRAMCTATSVPPWSGSARSSRSSCDYQCPNASIRTLNAIVGALTASIRTLSQ